MNIILMCLSPILASLGSGVLNDVGIPPVYTGIGVGVILAIGAGIILLIVVAVKFLIRLRNNKNKHD